MNILYNHFKKRKLSSVLKIVGSKNILKRRLTLFHIIIFGIGAMIGGGVFILPGLASYSIGPSVFISFLFAGVLSISIALSYSELSIHIPSSGGCYVYAEVCLGKMIGYVTAITLITVESLSMASVANGCASYIIGFFSFLNKEYILNIFIFKEFNFLPSIVVLLATAILYKGVNTSSIVSFILVTIKISGLITFVIIALIYLKIDNLVPFFRYEDAKINSILEGISMVVISYAGFDALCATNQESINPKRDLPIAMIVTVSFCIMLYITVTIAMDGLISYPHLKITNPMFVAIKQLPGFYFLKIFILIAAIAATFSVLLAVMYGISRWIFSLSNDKIFPLLFSKVNKKHEPVNAVLLSGLIIGIICSVVPIVKLLKLANTGFLFIYIVVSFAALMLNKNVSFYIRWISIINIITSSIFFLNLIQNHFWNIFLFFTLVLISYFVKNILSFKKKLIT